MGVAGAEFHIVADHDHGDASRRQGAEDGGQLLLELGVQALGGLVQQQDLRVKEQHLTQGGTLLLAAGQVVGMAVQQRRQAAERHRLLHPLLPQVGGYPLSVKGLIQILADGLFHKQRTGILRQHAHTPDTAHRAAIGRQRTAEQVERGGLARAVSAQQCQKLPLIHGEVKPLYHVRGLRLIAEPQALRRQHRAAAPVRLLRRQGQQRVICPPAVQEVPSLPDGDGRGIVACHRGPDPHGGGHGEEHLMPPAAQSASHLGGAAGTQQPPAVQNGGMGGKGQRLLQPVLRQEDSGTQLPVDASQRLQKVGGGDGIQLAGGLVQDQHLGLHDHDGRQTQKLLLAAGKLLHRLVEPVLNAEK